MGEWKSVKRWGHPFSQFSFTDDEKEHLIDEIESREIIVDDDFILEVEWAMQTPAVEDRLIDTGKVDRSNRKGQLSRFLKKSVEYEKMLKELQEFARHNLYDHKGELHLAASHVLTEMIELTSILDSKVTFYNPKGGRPPSISDKMAENLKSVFKSYEIPIGKSDDSFFNAVLSICLESLDKPHKAPFRATRKMN